MRIAKFEHYKMHIAKTPFGGLCEVPTSALTRISSSQEFGVLGSNIDGVCDGIKNVEIGFNFNFDRNNFNRVFISTNGALVPTNDLPNQNDGSQLDLWAINTVAKNYPIIAPFWSEMKTAPFSGSDYNHGHGIYYGIATINPGKRAFICRWIGNKTSYTGHKGHITFEAVLYENTNIVEYNYGQYVEQYSGDDNIDKPGFIYAAAAGINSAYKNPLPSGGEWARCRYYLSQSHSSNNTIDLDMGMFGVNPLGGSSCMYGFNKNDPHYGFWDNLTNHHEEFLLVWPGSILGKSKSPYKIIFSPPNQL